MKPKTIILMVIAIVCGLGASYMTSQLIANKGEEPVAELEKVNVLAAKKNLDMGTKLEEQDELFEVKEFIKGEEPENTVGDFEEVKQKYLKVNLRKGAMLFLDDVDDSPTSLPIPDGLQAVSLRVNVKTSVAGFANLPGSRVDILWTRRTGSDDETACHTLLENVLVLAADQTNTRVEGVNALPAQVITVALSHEDARRVTLAEEMGTMSLILRKPGDVSSPETAKISLKDLIKPKEEVEEESQEEEVVDGGSAPVNPVVPPIPQIEDGPLAVLPPDLGPKFKQHLVKIHTPEGVRTVTFLLDEDGKVIRDDIEEIGGLPLNPPAIAPPPTNENPVDPVAGKKESGKEPEEKEKTPSNSGGKGSF